MNKQDIYADLHPKFRDLSDTKFMHELPEEFKDPNMEYVRVASSTHAHPNNVKYYHSLGYRLVLMPGKEKQAHANSVKEKANVWEDPVRCVSETGKESYWMCISKEDFKALKKRQDDAEMQRITQNSKRVETPTEIRETSREVIDFATFQSSSDDIN